MLWEFLEAVIRYAGAAVVVVALLAGAAGLFAWLENRGTLARWMSRVDQRESEAARLRVSLR
jgi:hypothetical protein